MAKKTFADLIKEVHEKGLCGRCGGCVSFCSAGDFGVIELRDEGPPVYINKDKCLECGICYLICPQVPVFKDELKKKFEFEYPLGHYKRITVAKTTDEVISEIATDGGVVTSILLNLLEKGIIDGAILSKKTGPFSREPIIATTKQDIIDSAGSTFDTSHSIHEMSKYSTYTPTITSLKVSDEKEFKRLAVVGSPCQVTTMRKMQMLGVVPSNNIEYILGLFCTENFSFDKLHKEKLEKELGIKIEDIKKVNIKEDLIIELKNGKRVNVSFEKLEAYMRPACRVCKDYSNHFADISFGGLGSPDGFTTVLIRTKVGEEIYDRAVQQKYIIEEQVDKAKKQGIISKISKISNWKAERASKFLENLK
ncbi:MAG: Coenzyme F420 hydrogenase/dehydrogenase, beta subunit C-terminal domain [Candidatus Helarchaeota archaeon]